MLCLVAITYTSPKVSVTASKRVPRKKRGSPRGFKFEMCQINLTILRVRMVSNIRVYIFFVLIFYFSFVFICAKIGYGADC